MRPCGRCVGCNENAYASTGSLRRFVHVVTSRRRELIPMRWPPLSRSLFPKKALANRKPRSIRPTCSIMIKPAPPTGCFDFLEYDPFAETVLLVSRAPFHMHPEEPLCCHHADMPAGVQRWGMKDAHVHQE